MPIPTAKLAQKRAKLRTKVSGSSVTLSWTEWPNGAPDIDPTTGARPITTDPSLAPVQKTATVRAFVHFVAPITSGKRMFAEVQVGDAIVDFPLDLLRITSSGDTEFEVGDVVDELAFTAANNALDPETDASAEGDSIEPGDLENLSLEFAGKRWIQKEVGEELAKTWDTLYSGLNINRAMLVCKA
jgi:hypothetical protein